MNEPTRWTADNLTFYSGGTAWGVAPRGSTFAIGSATAVQEALRAGKAEAPLARRLHKAGVTEVSVEAVTMPLNEGQKSTLDRTSQTNMAPEPASGGLIPRYVPDPATAANWTRLATMAGVRLTYKATAFTTAHMEHWLGKIGVTVPGYLAWGGYRTLRDFPRLNPTWTFRGWAGLVLEHRDQMQEAPAHA